MKENKSCLLLFLCYGLVKVQYYVFDCTSVKDYLRSSRVFFLCDWAKVSEVL